MKKNETKLTIKTKREITCKVCGAKYEVELPEGAEITRAECCIPINESYVPMPPVNTKRVKVKIEKVEKGVPKPVIPDFLKTDDEVVVKAVIRSNYLETPYGRIDGDIVPMGDFKDGEEVEVIIRRISDEALS